MLNIYKEFNKLIVIEKELGFIKHLPKREKQEGELDSLDKLGHFASLMKRVVEGLRIALKVQRKLETVSGIYLQIRY